MHFTSLGAILNANALPAAIGKNKFDGLIGGSHAGCAIERHAARFRMYFLFRRAPRLARFAFGVRGALKIELHFAAASNRSTGFLVLAALRANDVVAGTGLAENGDIDVFEQAGVAVLKIRGLGGIDGEDFLIARHFRERNAVQ